MIRIFVGAVVLLTLAGASWRLGNYDSNSDAVEGQHSPAAGGQGTRLSASATEDIEEYQELDPVEREREWLEEGFSTVVPIHFFGQVIDQDGEGIPGVRVSVQTMGFDPDSPKVYEGAPLRIIVHELETDQEGRFALLDERGHSVIVRELKKEGYRVSRYNPVSFAYSDGKRIHDPDPAAPVLFRMWRQQEAEPLIHYRRRAHLGEGGKQTYLDLHTGLLREGGGDIAISVVRLEPETPTQRFQSDWIVRLEVPSGGGLIPVEGEAGWEAPAEGYQSSYELVSLAGDGGDRQEKYFFVKARNGQTFARVHLRFFAQLREERTTLTVEGYVNPNGSRNLEYDWSLQINPD
jgi:hypothetical protein